MKRILLKLMLALVTFSLGVSITAIYRLQYMPDAVLPEIEKVDQRFSCFPGLSISVPKSDAQREFFPAVALSDNAWSGRFANDWYTSQLKAMNEVPLAALENESESYRFLWLRSFHRPVAIHVWHTGERHFLVVKRLSGRGGYKPGTLDLYWARSLSEHDWDEFMVHLEHTCYWGMETDHSIEMFDGSRWILEGYREGRYHVVDRQSPDDGAYRDACLYLLRRSGLLAEIPDTEVY